MIEKRRNNGLKIKLRILDVIKETIQRSQWNQTTAAKIIGVDQPKVSQIMNGKAAGFSLERLLVFLLRVNCKIEITISAKRNALGATSSSAPVDLDTINLIILPAEE